MYFIYFILQAIPFMMLVIIALVQTDLLLFRKLGNVIAGRMKIRSLLGKKRAILEKGNL